MNKRTKIAWADSSANPWWGCLQDSPGCKHCYAKSIAKRTGHNCWGAGATREPMMSEDNWCELRRWDAEAAVGVVGKDGKHWIVFMGDMCDIFDDEGLPEMRERMWAEIKANENLTFLVLTKRPQNFSKYLPADWGEGYPNVWLGVTVDDCKHGYPRVDILRTTPAKVRFLSCEPLLENINDIDLTGIDWAIIGGESGPGSRPFNLEWARSLRGRCAAAGTAFFMKQLGQKPIEAGDPFPILNRSANGKRDIHGKSAANFPVDLNIQEWPDTPPTMRGPRLLHFPMTVRMTDAPSLTGGAGVLRDKQPTQAEIRHQAALKAWETRRANSAKVRQEDASTLLEPVWSDELAGADDAGIRVAELGNMLRWLSSWSNVEGPLGHMAGSAFESLTGMLSYFEACEAANAGGAA